MCECVCPYGHQPPCRYDSTAAPSESDGEEGDTEADDQPRAKKRKKDASKVGKPAKKQKLEVCVCVCVRV